ncbi:hypothetical protein GOODEAATRI_017469 [Goodea atripinnis]|uniref:Uncharacterized protein n=1 Tax=Goodea atripinnis TaxID=208336 RepID=A0ABV0MIM6_9TELE
MDKTFPLRGREIVEAGLRVKTLKEWWPALFTERQVFAEFNRIAQTTYRWISLKPWTATHRALSRSSRQRKEVWDRP